MFLLSFTLHSYFILDEASGSVEGVQAQQQVRQQAQQAQLQQEQQQQLQDLQEGLAYIRRFRAEREVGNIIV